MDDSPALVIDAGSGVCKSGFAGDDAPRSVIPTVVGRPKNNKIIDVGLKDLYIGDEAVEKKGLLCLSYPVQRGDIKDPEDYTKILHHIFFNELRVATEEHQVLMTEAPQTSRKTRETIAEMMFENFNVPGLSFGHTSVMALYASGKFTGLVVDSGEGITQIVPIFEGYSIYGGIKRMNYAGRSLTQFMNKLISEKGIHFSTTAELEIARQAKQRFCYVAMAYESELASAKHNKMLAKNFLLPDGQSLLVEEERFKCPEAFFKPIMMGIEGPGIDEAVYQSISNCDIDLRKTLYSSITLSGGNTMFPGFEARLEKELIHRIPKAIKVKITATPERKYSVWFGGSIFASLSSFTKTVIDKALYLERGPACLGDFNQSLKL